MTIDQEIEHQIRKGADPLFLYGLVELASSRHCSVLKHAIREAGTRVYEDHYQQYEPNGLTLVRKVAG